VSNAFTMAGRLRHEGWILAIPVLAAFMFAGCSADPPGRSAVTVGSDTNVTGWAETWEQAAMAEAVRQHPVATGLRAYRVHLPGIGDRVHVQGDFGFCRMYGGMGVKGRWQANEVGACDPRFIRGP
jgi:cation transport ATPase